MTWQTIGFDKNKKFFESLMSDNNFSHAYIFSGQEMTGKKTFALELANIVTASSFQDILLINAATGSESGQTIAIDEIRKIKNFVSLSPNSGRYKFVIIDDAHLMTIEAQNSLLKVLEEPGPSSILILVTANPEALLPTIYSRCQEIRFAPHPKTAIRDFLKMSVTDNTRANFLVDFANGRLGLIKNIVEGNNYEEIKQTIEELTGLIRADLASRLDIAQKLTEEKNKAELPKKVLYWMLYLRTQSGEPKIRKILKNLLVLNGIINKPQFNQRLALDNFAISL